LISKGLAFGLLLLFLSMMSNLNEKQNKGKIGNNNKAETQNRRAPRSNGGKSVGNKCVACSQFHEVGQCRLIEQLKNLATSRAPVGEVRMALGHLLKVPVQTCQLCDSPEHFASDCEVLKAAQAEVEESSPSEFGDLDAPLAPPMSGLDSDGVSVVETDDVDSASGQGANDDNVECVDEELGEDFSPIFVTIQLRKQPPWLRWLVIAFVLSLFIRFLGFVVKAAISPVYNFLIQLMGYNLLMSLVDVAGFLNFVFITFYVVKASIGYMLSSYTVEQVFALHLFCSDRLRRRDYVRLYAADEDCIDNVEALWNVIFVQPVIRRKFGALLPLLQFQFIGKWFVPVFSTRHHAEVLARLLKLDAETTAVVMRHVSSLRRTENFVQAVSNKYVVTKKAKYKNMPASLSDHNTQLEAESLARFLLVDSNWARSMFSLVDESATPISLNNQFKRLFPTSNE
jgi:hypothetical protein